MLYSIIIINYKTPRLTADCVRYLLALQSPQETEIIIIDNNSEDGSAESLQAEFNNKIKLISNHKNLGFAGANNQGAAIAQGEYLLFLNNDTIVKEDIFTASLNILQQNKNIGILSPRLKLENGNNQKAAFGKFPTLFKLLTQSTKIELNINEKQEFFITDWVSGCALIISRKLFQEIDGWDDHFFLYYEDIDICRRAHLKGYESAILPKINIVHLGGRSLKTNTTKKKIYHQSQDYYFKKHYGQIIFLAVKLARNIRILTSTKKYR